MDEMSSSSPLSMLCLFDPISVENRIWGDMNRTCRCDADGSKAFIQCDAESL
jgi:hypothetical protein